MYKEHTALNTRHTYSFGCTFHTGADQEVTMVQMRRQVNLVNLAFFVLAQVSSVVCLSLLLTVA